MFAFTFLYTSVFTIYYVSIQNFEFLWYVVVMLFFFILIASTLHRSKFSDPILWGLSIWGLLHVAGGGVIVAGDVLYAFQLIPFVQNGEFTILKYDQFVHFFGFGIATLVGYHLLKPYLKEVVNWKVLYFLIILIGAGFGVLNELVEFVAVLIFPQTGVGGYINTSLDLVFNTVGAIAGIMVIHFSRRRE